MLYFIKSRAKTIFTIILAILLLVMLLTLTQYGSHITAGSENDGGNAYTDPMPYALCDQHVEYAAETSEYGLTETYAPEAHGYEVMPADLAAPDADINNNPSAINTPSSPAITPAPRPNTPSPPPNTPSPTNPANNNNITNNPTPAPTQRPIAQPTPTPTPQPTPTPVPVSTPQPTPAPQTRIVAVVSDGWAQGRVFYPATAVHTFLDSVENILHENSSSTWSTMTQQLINGEWTF